MAVNVYREGLVHVRATPCDHCLFSPDRLVSGKRARELVAETRGEDGSSFVCHRSQVSTEPEAVCRAWWDAFSDEDWMLRLAKAHGIVKEVA